MACVAEKRSPKTDCNADSSASGAGLLTAANCTGRFMAVSDDSLDAEAVACVIGFAALPMCASKMGIAEQFYSSAASLAATLPGRMKRIAVFFFALLPLSLHFRTMGHRLSKIATRTGDNGTTGLGDGSRVEKDAWRVHAMGDVDELNAHIGLLLCEEMPAALREELVAIQHDLFDIGGELCIPAYTLLADQQVARLDALLAQYNADLPPLKDFILPAGSRAAAQAHVCRTVCRRAERAIVSLGKVEAVIASLRQYLIRLSDQKNERTHEKKQQTDGSDVLWHKDGRRN